MQAFEASTTVQSQGRIVLTGAPFPAGTEVEVIVTPKRASAAEFAAVWEQVCNELRKQPAVQGITDSQIQDEINERRAGR